MMRSLHLVALVAACTSGSRGDARPTDGRPSLGIVLFLPTPPKNLPRDSVDGAVVQFVDAASAAYRGGLRPLDRIIEVDGIRTSDPIEIAKALRAAAAERRCVGLGAVKPDGASIRLRCIRPHLVSDPNLLLADAQTATPTVEILGAASEPGLYLWTERASLAELARAAGIKKSAGEVCVERLAGTDSLSASCSMFAEDDWPQVVRDGSYVIQVRRPEQTDQTEGSTRDATWR